MQCFHKDLMMIFLIGALLAIIPEVINHNFYFYDDMQHYFMPVFYNIGRTLHEGHFPILSLNTWMGGNYLAEYQLALYNPVSLATYFILPYISSLADASAFLAISYLTILAGGTFYLSRCYGLDRYPAYLATIVVATNNFIAYWFATSWISHLISLAWFVWTWAFLLNCRKSGWHWFGTVLFCYLTITAGWPQASLFVGFFATAIILQRMYEKNYPEALAIFAAMTVTLLLCLPSLIPLVSAQSLASRVQETFNTDFLVPNLHDVLNMSFPLQLGMIEGFQGYRPMSTPFLYCAWFILPVLPLLKWDARYWKQPTNKTLVILAVITLIAIQGPERIGTLRWPFRYIPFLHIIITMVILRAMSIDGLTTLTRRNIGMSFGIIALGALLAWQKFPRSDQGGSTQLILYSMPWLYAEITIACMISWGAFLALWRSRRKEGYIVLALSTLFIFIFTRAILPESHDYANWGLSSLQNKNALIDVAPKAYTFYTGGAFAKGDGYDAHLDPMRLEEFQTGFMPLEYGHPVLGGYSPIGHIFYQKSLCMNSFGETCSDAAGDFFATDEATGVPLADLYRADHIIAMRGQHLENLLKYKPDEWHLEFSGKYTERYQRTLPNASLPGTLSWISPGIEVMAEGEPHALQEKLNVRHRGAQDKLIFARLWWPGYTATYAGQNIPVTPYRNILVSVQLPPDTKEGTLKLLYRPPYFCFSLTAAAIGILFTLLGCFVFRRREPAIAS